VGWMVARGAGDGPLGGVARRRAPMGMAAERGVERVTTAARGAGRDDPPTGPGRDGNAGVLAGPRERGGQQVPEGLAGVAAGEVEADARGQFADAATDLEQA